MPDNLTTFSPAQKEVYLGIIRESLNSKKQVMGWIEKRPCDGGPNPATGSATPPPRSCHFVAHTTRNATGTFMSPDGTFPTSGNQGYVQGSFIPRVMYWPILVTRSAIRNTADDRAAYARVLVEAAQRTGYDVTNEMERVACGDGSGFLGQWASDTLSTAAAGTITLTNPSDARRFQIGQNLNSWAARIGNSAQLYFANTTPIYCVTVTGINYQTGVLTVIKCTTTSGDGTGGAADNQAANAIYTKANDQAANPFNGARGVTTRYEPVGLDGIVSDRDTPMETGVTYGGLYGILAPSDFAGTTNGASGNAAWASYVNRATNGRALTDAILQSLIDRPMIDAGMAPDVIFTSYGGRWEYANSKLGIRRYVNTQSLSGAQGGGINEDEDAKSFLEFGGLPIVPVRFGPVGLDSLSNKTCSFIAVNTERLAAYEWHKPRFVDDDGLTWRMQSRTAQFEAVIEYAMEFVTDQRNAHAKATDIIAQDFV